MSVTVDANVLIYASNTADPVNELALSLVEDLAVGPELVYLFWPTVMGYLRIVTHPAIFPRPLRPVDAVRNVTQLIERPHIKAVGESDGFWSVFQETGGGQARGNDVPDTHLVALMRQHDVGIIYTRDRDFRRFDGIECRDPF